MADSYSGKLQLWEGWAPSRIKGSAPAPTSDRPLLATNYRFESAERMFAEETLSVHGRLAEGAEPFTLQWFLEIESARYRRQGSWIPRLLEFGKHKGETLLGLGHGLGTDWVQYARQAEVIVCCPTAEQLSLIQRHFTLRNLAGVFLHASVRNLPVETASIDVVCVTDVLQRMEEPSEIIEEIYRVLKPGGKILSVLPARFDIDYWRRRCLPWQSWLHPRRMVNPEAMTFSARGLKQLFGRFVEMRMYKRHLRRSEIPHIWRWLPLPILERLFGRYLVLKAFKPLSVANAVSLAA